MSNPNGDQLGVSYISPPSIPHHPVRSAQHGRCVTSNHLYGAPSAPACAPYGLGGTIGVVVVATIVAWLLGKRLQECVLVGVIVVGLRILLLLNGRHAKGCGDVAMRMRRD